MRFSIVTPAFNAAEHLPEMLASVRGQSFADWELRIVDDGSSDSTRALIEAAAAEDPRIKPLFLGANSGSDFLPRRKAIEASLGEYIVNIDADDTVEDNYLLRLDEAIRVSGADLVYADMTLISDHGAERFTRPEISKRAIRGKELFHLSLGRWKVSGMAATKRSLALRSLELFDGTMASEARWNSFDNENLSRLDLFLAKRVAFSQANYFYWQRPLSVTHAHSPKRLGLLSADMALCRFVAENFGHESEEYALAQSQLFHHFVETVRLLENHRDIYAARDARRLLSSAFKSLDRRVIRRHVSGRYRMLTRLGFPITRFIIGIHGRRQRT